MIQIGDNVRFLNAVGGGRVTKVDTKKNVVYVEDEDGFEVPVLATECVVVPKVNANTNFPVKDLSAKPAEQATAIIAPQQAAQPKPAETIIETAEGENFKALLAFFPTDIKRMETTGYECYLVNDCNYFLFYNLVIGEPGSRRSVASGLIEPNMQELLCEINKSELNDWEKLRVQIVAFKKDKTYNEQGAIDFTLKVNPVRFYKLHSFAPSDYFEEPHLLIDLNEEKERRQLADIDPHTLKQAMFEKKQSETRAPKQLIKKVDKHAIVEVDLHINSLLDSTAGMNNAEMLEYQMGIFHKTLEDNKNKRGQKIVFIHGKGEGVLRKEIEKQLKLRYKDYSFQDASFREYGFGATMVTIR